MKRRAIRVAEPYSRPLYFNDKERTSGISADFVRESETTTYVRNIYRYYVACKLMVEAEETRRKAREAVSPGK